MLPGMLACLNEIPSPISENRWFDTTCQATTITDLTSMGKLSIFRSHTLWAGLAEISRLCCLYLTVGHKAATEARIAEDICDASLAFVCALRVA
jgi:hypothetical protein